VAVVIAIPIIVLVSLLPDLGTATLAAAGASQLGVLARCRRNLRIAPTITVLLFAAMLALSHLRAEGGFAVAAEAARNTLLSTLIGLALVLSAMAADVKRLAIVRALAGTGFVGSLYLLNAGLFVGGRLTTENLNANSVGHVAALALLAAWGAFLATRRPWWLICAAPAALLLVLSQSRGALVIVAIGTALPWIFHRLSLTRVLLAGSIMALLYAAWPLISGGLSELLSSRVYTETETRANVLQLALRAIIEHPLTGLGWRTFPDYSYLHLGIVLNTHNEYMRIGAESGLPALAALLALAFIGLRRPIADSTGWALKGIFIGGLTALAFANTLSVLAICTPIWLVLGTILGRRRDLSTAELVARPRCGSRQST
jgi:O-antigen ligase